MTSHTLQIGYLQHVSKLVCETFISNVNTASDIEASPLLCIPREKANMAWMFSVTHTFCSRFYVGF